MNKPEMIMFDWGGTLAKGSFDGLRGTKAVLDASLDTNGCTAEEVQRFAEVMNRDFGRVFDYAKEQPVIEVHQHKFQRYLYEYFGVTFDKSEYEIEEIFFRNCHDIYNTDGIADFLNFLHEQGIRTAVISNIDFTDVCLKRCISEMLPDNHFEFIIASSEYVYRKPHSRIFELALRKAGLTAEKVWYIGDNVVCDIMGAVGCGITPVWYNGALHSEQTPPDINCIIVSEWSELKKIIYDADKNPVLI